MLGTDRSERERQDRHGPLEFLLQNVLTFFVSLILVIYHSEYILVMKQTWGNMLEANPEKPNLFLFLYLSTLAHTNTT